MGLGDADAITNPPGVRRENRLAPEGDDLIGPIRDVGNSQLVLAVGTVDAVGHPFAVGGQSDGGERFELAVILGSYRGFGLCPDDQA